MWRSNVDSDWEQRKMYLLRSMFIAVLPPVPEEDELPASPLPSLIIEKEPNRHDEPEEFYIELEKIALKIYRKLFIEGKSDISSISSDFVEDDVPVDFEEQISSTPLHESLNKPYSDPEEVVDDVTVNFEEQISSNVHDTSNESCNDLDQIPIERKSNDRSILKRAISPDEDGDMNVSKSKKSKSTKVTSSSTEASPESTIDDNKTVSDSLSSNDDEAEGNADTTVVNNTPPTDYSGEVLQVTFKADVHREADYEFVQPPNVVHECAENVIHEAVDVKNISDGEVVLKNNTVSDKNIHAGYSDATEIIDEIEIMRVQPIRPSAGFHHNEEHTPSSDEMAIEEAPRQLERHTESVSSHDRASMEMDINLDLLRRSSVERNCDRFRKNSTSSMRSYADAERHTESVSSHDRASMEMDINLDLLRRSSVERNCDRFRKNSTSSMRSYADAEVQVPLNHESTNRELLRDIFVGTPRVFRLCSCVNHSCTR